MKFTLVLVIAAAVAVAACRDSDRDNGPLPTLNVPTALRTPGGAPDAPAPVHHAFAPGQIIDVEDAGIFFVDIETGAGEAWVTPASADNPFAFWLSGVSNDGSKLIYTCAQSGSTGLHPCGGKTSDTYAHYLFDTETGDRQRLEAFTELFASLSPDGETVLGLSGDGSLLRASANEPGSVETITLAEPGAPLLHAYWAPDGHAAIVLLGVPGNPSTAAVLLANDATASTTLVDAGVLVQWSPDSRLVALVDIVKPGMWVFDERGALVWTKPEEVAGGNVRCARRRVAGHRGQSRQ